VRSDLVVIDSPRGNGKTRLLQRLKPVLVQTFIPERAIEALDVCVLSWTARLNQDVLDAVLLCPSHECSASELRPVVGSDRLGIAPKRRRPIEQTGHVMPTNTKVSGDVHALVREVVSYRQAFDAPRDSAWPGDRIAHKVHAPGLVDGHSGHQWYAHAYALCLLALV
jgi:hypothetical protein